MQDKLTIVSSEHQSSTAALSRESARAPRMRQRQRLIDACISALHLYGPSRTTVEKVVAIANLSPGIVRFYFDSKDAMLVASLAFLASEFEERVFAPVARLKSTPTRALERLVQLYLDPEIASPRKVSVWYSFWGEASSRPEYLDICGKKDEAFATLVRELIEAVVAEAGLPHLDADAISLGLIGVLEVLWQGIAFQNEENIDRAAARRRSLAYLASVFPGMFTADARPAGETAASGARRAAGMEDRLPGWAYADAGLFELERERLLRPSWQVVGLAGQLAGGPPSIPLDDWPTLHAVRTETMSASADWKLIVEQWLDNGVHGRYFLPPNQLLDLASEPPQLLQALPEAAGRTRMVRLVFRRARRAGRAGRAGRARPPRDLDLAREIALAESTQRGLEALPAQAQDAGPVAPELARFRRSIATLLPSHGADRLTRD